MKKMKPKQKKILCIPETREGHGTGHVIRCLEILKAAGSPGSGLYVDDINAPVVKLIPEEYRITSAESAYDLIVVDKRNTNMKTMEWCVQKGLTIGIDARGAARPYFDYLVDILPQLNSRHAPNIREPGFLTQPTRTREKPLVHPDNILLVFGGEDYAGLSSKMARYLVEKHKIAPERITALIGVGFKDQRYPPGVKMLRQAKDARELFADFDLVISQFGLGLFEAAAAGCAVAGFHPSRYHHQLAEAAGFFSLGVKRPKRRAVQKMLAHFQVCFPPASLKSAPQCLGQFLAGLTPLQDLGTPVRGSRLNIGIARSPQETFFRCKSSGLVFKQRYKPLSIDYNSDYFGQEYREQYGRTYEEDFDTILDMGHRRMALVKELAGEAGDLLDLGCALGPFLEAARQTGWNPYGVDISQSAVDYVKSKLKLPALASDLLIFDPQSEFGQDKFDALTMWYVIEHIPQLDALLNKVNSLLKPGGLFAFSTPNGAGISARKNQHAFLCDGPEDHFLVFNPWKLQGLCRQYGFKLERIVVTGHHPERFPLVGKSPSLGPVIGCVSRSAGLGDTFEAYWRKIGEPLL